MQRIAFIIRVRPEKLAEYRKLHNPIWPELAADLRASGIRNYSLWLQPDGTEFGYLECDDWAATCASLDRSEVHTRWADADERVSADTDRSPPGRATGTNSKSVVSNGIAIQKAKPHLGRPPKMVRYGR